VAACEKRLSVFISQSIKAFTSCVTTYLRRTGFSAVAVMKTKYRQWLIIETELRDAISTVTLRFGKLWAEKKLIHHTKSRMRRL